MRPMTTRATATAALALLGVVPVLTSAATLETRFTASSYLPSQVSMFTYHEGQASRLSLRAAPVLSGGEGKAVVSFENGNARVAASVRRMPPPSWVGPYATYVLWSLTPDGRATNEGELAGLQGGKSKLAFQHSGSRFTLFVTAEPHFAVSEPSNMIVMYSVADKLGGTEARLAARPESADYSDLTTIEQDGRPAELVQAEYSLALARASEAETYAPSQLYSAQAKLVAARNAWALVSSPDQATAPAIAREAVIAGEDARRAALVASVAARDRAERQAAADAALAAERERATAAEAAAARAAALEAETRAGLVERLGAVLPTRETDRGLVSEISGVQFATGTAELDQTAREILARFSGIVASYPELSLRIEGHTDSVGSEAANSELSLLRAIRVRDYLVGLGIPESAIEVDGLGESRPIADNDTAAGRALNRRVEIIISDGLRVDVP